MITERRACLSKCKCQCSKVAILCPCFLSAFPKCWLNVSIPFAHNGWASWAGLEGIPKPEGQTVMLFWPATAYAGYWWFSSLLWASRFVGINESEGQIVTLPRQGTIPLSFRWFPLLVAVVFVYWNSRQIVRVILSESAYNFRISVLHCKAFLLCLDEFAHQCNHRALENAFFSVS